MVKTKPFDAAEYLDSREVIVAYLTDAIQSDDPHVIRLAAETAARCRFMNSTMSSRSADTSS